MLGLWGGLLVALLVLLPGAPVVLAQSADGATETVVEPAQHGSCFGPEVSAGTPELARGKPDARILAGSGSMGFAERVTIPQAHRSSGEIRAALAGASAGLTVTT